MAPHEAAGSDPGLLLTALGEPITPDGIARISPFRFTAPVSPHLAARREGKKIDFNAVVELCRWRMQSCPGALIIEGVGGVMNYTTKGAKMTRFGGNVAGSYENTGRTRETFDLGGAVSSNSAV